jgi:hypothetical protein
MGKRVTVNTSKQVRNGPPEPPPIARYLGRNPWFLPRLLSRNVPG